MMKAIAVVLVLAFGLAGCTCAAEKQAVREIRDTHKLVLPEYLKYVEKDALGAPEKDRRRKLVESLERLVDRLEKSLEE
jgi:hypothetical protein